MVNQPLNFDPSSVRTMEEMFKVHAPPIPLLLAPTPPRTVCPAPCVPVSTRQNAKAFNQPLNFNTSSVTTMDTMFYVCTPPAPCSNSSRAFPCTLHARPPPHRPPLLMAHTPPRFRLGRKRNGSTSQ